MRKPDDHRRASRARGGLVRADYEALAELRYLLRKFLGFSEAAARKAGLTAQQHQALLAIHGFAGGAAVSIGALAERLNVRHHSVVGLVGRLASKGLVKRRRDPRDVRRVLLTLDAKGLKILAGLSHAHRAELRRVAPALRRILAEVQRS